MPDNVRQEYQNTIGYSPVVYYNGYHVQPEDVKNLVLDNTGFYPEVHLIMKDSMNIMSDKAFPLDNTIITIFINPRADEFEPIHCDFKITTFEIIKRDGDSNLIMLDGVLNVDYLYIQKSYSLSQKSSYEALEAIATEAQIGFASNISSTSDTMTWINPGDEGINFIKQITERSYISDSAFLYSYVDPYYYLNFVDIEAAMEDDASSQTGIMSIGTNVDQNVQQEQKTAPLILTNDKSYKETNNYFDRFNIVNQSTKNAIDHGHRRKIHYYDRSGNWEEKAGEFKIFDMDSITTPGIESSGVILKGAPGDQSFLTSNVKNLYVGKLDKDNMHENAPYAFAQNKQNIIDVQKVVVQLHLPTPNYLLYRYQKVRVAFSQQETSTSASHINNRLSGHWLIVGISNEYSKGENEQVVTLVKRELNNGEIDQ
jgi:hypothetical protein